jgi:hypothetical protein
MGSGILMDCYVQALLPLTDGLPPRSMESIIEIIEKDMNEVMKKNKNNNPGGGGGGGGGGIKVSDLFLKIDPKPLGAASIAQVHKATLLDGMPFFNPIMFFFKLIFNIVVMTIT